MVLVETRTYRGQASEMTEIQLGADKFASFNLRVGRHRKLVTSASEPALVTSENIIIKYNNIYSHILLLVSSGSQTLVTSFLRVLYP